MLSEIIAEAQLTNELDRTALQNRLMASRLYRDTMLMDQPLLSFQAEGAISRSTRSRFERGPNNGGRSSAKNGRGSDDPATCRFNSHLITYELAYFPCFRLIAGSP